MYRVGTLVRVFIANEMREAQVREVHDDGSITVCTTDVIGMRNIFKVREYPNNRGGTTLCSTFKSHHF